MLKVRVKPGVTYGAGGKYQPGEELEVEEIAFASFGDKLELVALPVEVPEGINATPQAVELAMALGVDLRTITTGSGKDGRITVGDVKAAEGESG